VFILVALLAFGGRSLTDFALALLIGILVGTYSSMFLATPLAVTLESRPRGLADPRRVAATGQRPRRPVPRVSQGVDNYGS
jgi:SecD/SecF fusion protein